MRFPPELVLSLPLAAAAILIALLDRIPRKVTQWIAIVVAIVTLVGTTALLVNVVQHGPRVVWVGGWHPGNRVGLGIALAIDLAGAGVAEFIAVTVLAAIVFSYEYFENVGAIFYVLILAMLGAMIAFSYAADVFNLFVWYEVFSVAAYALAAYRSESKSAYEGALQFALTNSVAGLFFLIGITLLEGRTGELNLVAIGHSLAVHQHGDALIATSLACIAIGLFTRGALAPLHFWFDEVHAAAPAPLCAILSGAMVPLALYGFARVYWTVFERVLPPSAVLVATMVGIGALSACMGTIMSLRESRLKRKLAHTTVAHSGIALAVIGQFTPRSLAAAGAYEASYATAAAALFFAIAILRSVTNEYDAKRLRGAGRGLPITGVAFALGALTLASVWTAGRAVVGAADGPANAIVAVLVTLVGAGTGGAFGTAFINIFVRPPSHARPRRDGGLPWFLLTPAVGLALISAALGMLPATRTFASSAASFLSDHQAYGDVVMRGVWIPRHSVATLVAPIIGWLTPLGAVVVTILGVTGAPRYRRLRIALARNGAVKRLVAINSGDPGAYIAWIAGSASVLTVAISFACK